MRSLPRGSSEIKVIGVLCLILSVTFTLGSTGLTCGSRSPPETMSTMLTKDHRQKRIQELVSKEFVSTQAEIVERLTVEGVAVTQATVSRDITELRLVRLPMGKGKHRYALAPYALTSDTTEELRLRFKEFVRDVDRGENIVVIKTKDGHAMGIALVMDKLSRDDIVGTLAGQDTIFVTARNVALAEALVEEFTEYLLQ